MTEKVVSLSGGLVLGMAFALFLSVSTTQTMNSPIHMEYPSVSGLIGLNDLQSYRSSSSSQASDTTPSISAAPPAQEEDRGRIIRIATVTETSEPVFTAPAQNSSPAPVPKTFSTETENVYQGSTLQQMHQQHSYIASSSVTSGNCVTIGQIARQSNNFTSIASNGGNSGVASSSTGGQPTVVDSKPQTNGTPTIAQNDPGEENNNGGSEGEGQEPAIAGFSNRPPDPDSMNDNHCRRIDPYIPEGHNSFGGTEQSHGGGHHNPDPHGTENAHQEHRPETD